jgi:hypothetical protein
MSLATADIVGNAGTALTLTLDSGSIVNAFLKVAGQADAPLTVSGNLSVSVPKLPSGESIVHLDILWEPGDKDAVIGVNGADAADPAHTIDAGDTPGFVELFGR